MRYLLLDVNVWLSTLVAAHPHHDQAVAWWRSSLLAEEGRAVFCRTTQLGLLRLLTNERVMGDQRKSMAEAWAIYEQVLSRPKMSFASEPEATEEILAKHCQLGGSSPKLWTDAYLAAFATAGELGLVTFDRGFRRYPDLDLRVIGT